MGDKTRMETLSTCENVFIRPSPSGGALGGVARATYETMLLCEAAGYDFIIIETVGVGQSEVAVKQITDFFLLLMLAGAGDELQGIKRGIMEMADAMVITKADGSNLLKAKAARAEYQRAMHLFPAHESGFIPEVHLCSSTENRGMEDVYDLIDRYRRHTVSSGYMEKRRKDQQTELLKDYIDERLRIAFYSDKSIKEALQKFEKQNSVLPFGFATKLLSDFLKKK
jgi:LAO/AO transport system kinase